MYNHFVGLQNVKTLDNQVEWFKSYINEVISLVGEENGNTLISDALYFVSTGANDYIDHFLAYVTPTPLYDTLPQLQANLLGNAKQHLQVCRFLPKVPVWRYISSILILFALKENQNSKR
jgi:phospholipase/lecithinase/hemolysin